MFETKHSLTVTGYTIWKPEGERATVNFDTKQSPYLDPLRPLLFNNPPQESPALRDFLEGRPVIEHNNSVEIKFENGTTSLADRKELIQRLFFGENPLITFKEEFGKLHFKIELLPETIYCTHPDYNRDVVAFSTQVTLLTKVPRLTLQGLRSPFTYGYGFSLRQAIAARAILEFGDKVESIITKDDEELFWGYHALVNRDYYENHPIEIFAQKIFGDKAPTALKIIDSLKFFEGGEKAWDIKSHHGARFSIDLDFKCTSINRFLQDMRDIFYSMQKAIKRLEKVRKGERFIFSKFTRLCHGQVSVDCECWQIPDMHAMLLNDMHVVQQVIAITKLYVLPFEKSLGPEFEKVKPFRRMNVAIVKYLFRGADLDPIAYTDHENEYLRKYARLLIS